MAGLVGWLVGWLADWLAVWLVGWLAGCLAGWLIGWLAGWLAGWLVGWLPGWLAGWLAGWLVGLFSMNQRDVGGGVRHLFLYDHSVQCLFLKDPMQKTTNLIGKQGITFENAVSLLGLGLGYS